ncbi:MAG: methyltransferase domain-containing protein [Desulfobacteraceae bacterium]|nr:MAG: methyltransferase domain-containing protein [Desulfobacteraceae bacterium]
MRKLLFELLRCPQCKGKLQATSLTQSPDGEEIVEGWLECGCGASYPIINTIPRMLKNPYELFPSFVQQHGDLLGARGFKVTTRRPQKEFDILLSKTQESFGYQWTVFSEMICDFRDNFWNYLYPATPEYFKGRLGLDAGCGFGRHIYHAASCGAEMVGIDLSRAIDSTYQNTKQFKNVHLVQADIYELPFQPSTFDFAYSIGVLHHLPDPARGVQSVAAMVKTNGTFSLWLYSSTRRISNFLLEGVRAVTIRLPHPLVNAISFVGAVLDRYGLVWPYLIMRRLPLLGELLERLTPARIRMYSHYPFQVLHADWFDRLAAPIRFYYSEQEVRDLLQGADIVEIQTSPTGYYGWRGCGIRRTRSKADVATERA